ncbi:hypothetical protein LLY41_02675 [Cytobacillus firmus]|uniref:hypothetical protein n=1 Tax=Cytobacillus firmus TaxID=1399 RepID=UPI00218585BC|nr:hypothetical protein [Cytobacillus firmus]URM33406.1 hypothetical protein LLY41_02675 [Cytobacillus firmus]
MSNDDNNKKPKKIKQTGFRGGEYYGANNYYRLSANHLYVKDEEEGDNGGYKRVSKYVKIKKIEQAENTKTK